jgi:acetyl-CoA/propionyl-CoA carboxylase biotin carboxyl carrier protein
MDLRTIAVYSELDRDAVHVQLADEAWNIGPPPAAGSYLDIDRIMAVAAESGAEAVHPGYGFLAENGDFAQAVIDAGLTWVGPAPEAIRIMGDKIRSRIAVDAAGVKSVPGTMAPVESAEEVIEFAESHGFPIAIKAAHGGGGRGMKVVGDTEAIPAAFDSARREAEAWFSNPAVYVERYLETPRHIEAQIIVDGDGNGVFLGERDCTMQRRHQKLVEETPAVGLTDDVRAAIGAAALQVAAAANYTNAGTVEFLLDGAEDFYFLEMNTRLQVEHTVTEEVTGVDIVKEQLRVAASLPLTCQNVTPRGHAIEFRINAEDPAASFQPNPGTLVEYDEPGGLGVRVDSGVRAGSTISQYYDNLIAKLIVWGRDRDEALARGKRALEAFTIKGVATTIPALLRIIDTPQFKSGTHYTSFVESELDFSDLKPGTAPTLPEEEELAERTLTVEVGGKHFNVRFWAPVMAPAAPGGQRAAPRRRPPKLDRGGAVGETAGVLVAPMQGTIVKVHKKAGSSVKAGEPVCVLEAMKMENEIKAPIAGEIVELRVQTGDTVASGSVLMLIR